MFSGFCYCNVSQTFFKTISHLKKPLFRCFFLTVPYHEILTDLLYICSWSMYYSHQEVEEPQKKPSTLKTNKQTNNFFPCDDTAQDHSTCNTAITFKNTEILKNLHSWLYRYIIPLLKFLISLLILVRHLVVNSLQFT